MEQQQTVQHLLLLSQARGVLKYTNGTFVPFKLAYQPFVSSKQYYDYLGETTQIWHNVLFKVAQDRQLIIDIFTPLAEHDEMVKGLLNIYKKSRSDKKEGIVLDRIDYFNDESGQPKLIQFNLFAVGMQSHMQQFQQAKRLLEFDNGYVETPTASNFAEAIKEMIQLKSESGAVLFILEDGSANLLDNIRFEIQIRKRGIKVVRAFLKGLIENINKHQNGDLYYGKQKISVVYYRHLYRMSHLVVEGHDISKSWEVQQVIEQSNATCIPPVEFRLINLKRIQTQLAKPEILRKYATESEVEKLMKTRVKQWEFDTMNADKLKELIDLIEVNPEGYVLKPNKEGGGNNTFGAQLLEKIKEMSLQELRSFIVMERIKTKEVNNLIIDGSKSYREECEYQVSRYGTLTWFKGQIVRNQPDGFLIRAKPPSAPEGGIMVGVGTIVTWKIQ